MSRCGTHRECRAGCCRPVLRLFAFSPYSFDGNRYFEPVTGKHHWTDRSAAYFIVQQVVENNVKCSLKAVEESVKVFNNDSLHPQADESERPRQCQEDYL